MKNSLVLLIHSEKFLDASTSKLIAFDSFHSFIFCFAFRKMNSEGREYKNKFIKMLLFYERKKNAHKDALHMIKPYTMVKFMYSILDAGTNDMQT